MEPREVSPVGVRTPGQTSRGEDTSQVTALVFEFLASPPRSNFNHPTSLNWNLVSNWWKSHKLIGGECEVKVRNWGQITE